jgi:N,N'-diacetyllegionaminate synthase
MKKFKKVFIIAEAGVNHNGSLSRALRLVDEAKKSKADAIKFQTWKTENVVTKNSPKAEYQKKNNNKETHFNMLKKLELTYDQFLLIKKYCDKKKIIFMSTADEIESAIFLKPLVKYIKVGSAELTDIPFLEKIAKFNKVVFLSTGLSNIDDVKLAFKTLLDNGQKKEDIILLHCNSAYPTPFADVNLNAMLTLQKLFNTQVGYSDHTKSIEVSIAAVAMGAKVIEKHFTLNKKLKGPDHNASLSPFEFSKLVKSIRNVETSLGTGEKKPSKSEIINFIAIRKSIVAKENIFKGESFTKKNLTIKRPGKGMHPKFFNKLIGKKSNKNYKIDDFIKI